jgi:hypothetical protein
VVNLNRDPKVIYLLATRTLPDEQFDVLAHVGPVVAKLMSMATVHSEPPWATTE